MPVQFLTSSQGALTCQFNFWSIHSMSDNVSSISGQFTGCPEHASSISGQFTVCQTTSVQFLVSSISGQFTGCPDMSVSISGQFTGCLTCQFNFWSVHRVPDMSVQFLVSSQGVQHVSSISGQFTGCPDMPVQFLVMFTGCPDMPV